MEWVTCANPDRERWRYLLEYAKTMRNSSWRDRSAARCAPRVTTGVSGTTTASKRVRFAFRCCKHENTSTPPRTRQPCPSSNPHLLRRHVPGVGDHAGQGRWPAHSLQTIPSNDAPKIGTMASTFPRQGTRRSRREAARTSSAPAAFPYASAGAFRNWYTQLPPGDPCVGETTRVVLAAGRTTSLGVIGWSAIRPFPALLGPSATSSVLLPRTARLCGRVCAIRLTDRGEPRVPRVHSSR